MQKQITVQDLIWDLATNYKPTDKVEFQIECSVTGHVELRSGVVEEVEVAVDKTVTEPNLCGSHGRAIISLFVG